MAEDWWAKVEASTDVKALLALFAKLDEEARTAPDSVVHLASEAVAEHVLANPPAHKTMDSTVLYEINMRRRLSVLEIARTRYLVRSVNDLRDAARDYLNAAKWAFRLTLVLSAVMAALVCWQAVIMNKQWALAEKQIQQGPVRVENYISIPGAVPNKESTAQGQRKAQPHKDRPQ